MKTYRNILVVRTDRIGDVVLTTPVLPVLRQSFPDARITLLVSPLTVDLVSGNPDVFEILVDDRMGVNKGLRGFMKLVSLLKSKRFDLAINFHTKKRTNLLCFLAGIPERIGYYNEKYGFLLTQKIFDVRPSGEKHESQYCLDVLKALDIYSNEIKLFVPLQKESEGWADVFFNEQKLTLDPMIIAVHPGSSCPTKKWPGSKFVELIHAINDKYAASFILIGSRYDEKCSHQIMDSLDVPVVDVTGKTSLAQLASLLKRCHLLVSNDSGPVHIAAALDVPVISIFTRNQPGINPERWRPLNKKAAVISVPRDNRLSFKKGVVEDPEYLETIRVEDVLEAVDSIFKLC